MTLFSVEGAVSAPLQTTSTCAEAKLWRRLRAWSFIAALAGLAAACGEPTAVERFAEDVAPVLENRCASTTCHGVAEDAEERGEHIDWSLFFVRVDRNGKLTDVAAAMKAALRARAGEPDPAFTPLLRKPLGVVFGGLPHHGRDNFYSPEDPAYVAVAQWLESVADDVPEKHLTPDEQLFADTAQPALDAAMCGNANCHGPRAPVPFRLDPGIGGKRSRSAILANYETALAMISLDGSPERSRIVVKGLPVTMGGIAHKGGNDGLFTGLGDPRAKALLTWICAEQKTRTGVACASKPGTKAPAEQTNRSIDLFFVQGALGARDAFDLDAWMPGTQVWRGRLDTKTAQLADAKSWTPAASDARDPAVSLDGTFVVYSQRDDVKHGHAIWRRSLGGGDPVRLTEPGTRIKGVLATDRDPAVAPDGRIWFVSTRARQRADSRPVDAELFVINGDGKGLQRRTFTPHIERKPIFLRSGDENGGEIAFVALRDVFDGGARAHPFRFPPDMSTEYHQHFGVTPLENLFWDMRELPDGRYVAIAADLAGKWRGGQLVIFDRNFGPELRADHGDLPLSLPAYSAPMQRLDEKAKPRGLTGRMWRDPVVLADGRLLAATVDGPLDLGASTGTHCPHLVIARIDELPGGDGAALGPVTAISQSPGICRRDPEPVRARWTHASGKGSPKPAKPALLYHQGLPMIDAVLANLEPTGLKKPRPDIRGVRVIEALRHTANPPATSGSASYGDPTHRHTGRVLGELALAADGSFQVEVPPGTPFRLQALDAENMAVGVAHNRWFYIEAGQVMRQGVAHQRSADYDGACAGCHGAADGDKNHAFSDVDAVTTASLTLSRYENGDPRRPKPPVVLGDKTRTAVDYKRDIGPLLDKRCTTSGCHSGAKPAAGLRLDAADTSAAKTSYKGLIRRGFGSKGGRVYIDLAYGTARGSLLAERIMGKELDAPAVVAGKAPHPQAAPLTVKERALVFRWLDLGAPWDVDGGQP